MDSYGAGPIRNETEVKSRCFRVVDFNSMFVFLRQQVQPEVQTHQSQALLRDEPKMVSLKDIVPAAQNNIDTKFILLDKGSNTMEGQNKTCLALVADETAAVHFQLWGDECDAFHPGDIIQLDNGIFSYIRNTLLLRAGKRGRVKKVGEFTMVFVETPNMSEICWVRDPNDSKKYVQEAVILPHSRIFPPKY